jgi:hypothetical protein
MKLHCDSQHPDWKPEAARARVFLAGSERGNVVWADEEGRAAIVIKLGADGEPCDAHGKPLKNGDPYTYENFTGDVAIVIDPPTGREGAGETRFALSPGAVRTGGMAHMADIAMGDPGCYLRPQECAASGAGHSDGAHGPNGEAQCAYCGQPPTLAEQGLDLLDEVWKASGGCRGGIASRTYAVGDTLPDGSIAKVTTHVPVYSGKPELHPDALATIHMGDGGKIDIRKAPKKGYGGSPAKQAEDDVFQRTVKAMMAAPARTAADDLLDFVKSLGVKPEPYQEDMLRRLHFKMSKKGEHHVAATQAHDEVQIMATSGFGQDVMAEVEKIIDAAVPSPKHDHGPLEALLFNKAAEDGHISGFKLQYKAAESKLLKPGCLHCATAKCDECDGDTDFGLALHRAHAKWGTKEELRADGHGLVLDQRESRIHRVGQKPQAWVMGTTPPANSIEAIAAQIRFMEANPVLNLTVGLEISTERLKREPVEAIAGLRVALLRQLDEQLQKLGFYPSAQCVVFDEITPAAKKAAPKKAASVPTNFKPYDEVIFNGKSAFSQRHHMQRFIDHLLVQAEAQGERPVMAAKLKEAIGCWTTDGSHILHKLPNKDARVGAFRRLLALWESQ